MRAAGQAAFWHLYDFPPPPVAIVDYFQNIAMARRPIGHSFAGATFAHLLLNHLRRPFSSYPGTT